MEDILKSIIPQLHFVHPRILNYVFFPSELLYFNNLKLIKGWDIIMKTHKKNKHKIIEYITKKYIIHKRGIQYEMDGIKTIILNKKSHLIQRTVSFKVIKDDLCFLLRSSGKRIQHPSKKMLFEFMYTICDRFPSFIFVFANKSNGRTSLNHDSNLFTLYTL